MVLTAVVWKVQLSCANDLPAVLAPALEGRVTAKTLMNAGVAVTCVQSDEVMHAGPALQWLAVDFAFPL